MVRIVEGKYKGETGQVIDVDGKLTRSAFVDQVKQIEEERDRMFWNEFENLKSSNDTNKNIVETQLKHMSNQINDYDEKQQKMTDFLKNNQDNVEKLKDVINVKLSKYNKDISNIKETLKTGEAMIFPAEPIWIHGTEPVTEGSRYSINCFLHP